MTTLEPIQRLSVPVDPADAKQMLAQRWVWCRSQLAALSAADQTGCSGCNGTITGERKPAKLFHAFHFEITWGCFGAETNTAAKGLLIKKTKKQPIPVYVWSQLWSELLNLEWCSTWPSMYTVLPFTSNTAILTKTHTLAQVTPQSEI